jgi:hypothetical protein
MIVPRETARVAVGARWVSASSIFPGFVYQTVVSRENNRALIQRNKLLINWLMFFQDRRLSHPAEQRPLPEEAGLAEEDGLGKVILCALQAIGSPLTPINAAVVLAFGGCASG